MTIYVPDPDDLRGMEPRGRDIPPDELERPALTALAVKAHAIEDSPGTPIEDADKIESIIGK